MPTHTDMHQPLGDNVDVMPLDHTIKSFEEKGNHMLERFGSLETFKRATWGQFIRILYEEGYEIYIQDEHRFLIEDDDSETGQV